MRNGRGLDWGQLQFERSTINTGARARGRSYTVAYEVLYLQEIDLCRVVFYGNLEIFEQIGIYTQVKEITLDASACLQAFWVDERLS